MSVYTGSCLCGSVTYEAEGEPRRVLNAIVTGVRRLLVAPLRKLAHDLDIAVHHTKKKTDFETEPLD